MTIRVHRETAIPVHGPATDGAEYAEVHAVSVCPSVRLLACPPVRLSVREALKTL